MGDMNKHMMIIESVDRNDVQILRCVDCSRTVKRIRKNIFQIPIREFFVNGGWDYTVLDYGDSNYVHWVRDSE
jgi:hypothetical protein